MTVQFVSEQSAVQEVVGGLTELVTFLEGVGQTQNAGYTRAYKEAFINAFDAVAQVWASDIENRLDDMARQNRTTSMGSEGPWMHWSRHLYAGGNPKYMGYSSKRLLRFEAYGGAGEMGINIVPLPDNDPSWSPVSNTTTNYWGTREYPAWEGRAYFMMNNKKRTRGTKPGFDRTGRYGPWQEPAFYIVNRKSGSPGDQSPFVLASSFEMNYGPQKKQRDFWFAKAKKTSTGLVMESLDESFIASVEKTLATMKSKVNFEDMATNLVSPAFATRPQFSQTARFASRGVDTRRTRNKYAPLFAATFRKEVETKSRRYMKMAARGR